MNDIGPGLVERAELRLLLGRRLLVDCRLLAGPRAVDELVDMFEELLHLLDAAHWLGTVGAATAVAGLLPPGDAELHLYGHAEALEVDTGLWR